MTRTNLNFNGLITSLYAIAILLSIGGQFFLAQHLYFNAIITYTFALIAWLGALWTNTPLPRVAKLDQSIAFLPNHKNSRQIILFPVSVVFAFLTFLTSTDNTFTSVNVTLWLLSIFTFVFAFWQRGTGTFVLRIPRGGIFIPWRMWGLLIVFALSAFFYYYHLDQLPGEMTSDHAEKILDIHDVLNGARPIFFIRNTGREPLQFYLTALFVTVANQRLDHMALKWITATLGFLVVPLTFFLARTLFDDLVGLLAAVFVGINLWGVGIARMGLRFPFTPFFTALTFIFLFRALKYQRRNDYLWTGLALGAGLYGYHAFKIVPLVVVGCFGLWLLFEGRIRSILRSKANWAELRRYISNIILVGLLALIVFMPLLRYMTEHPESFWYRVLTRVSEQERPLQSNPALIFADNIKNVLLMFNVQGDRSWPNTLSEVPVLDEMSGGLFVLGIVYALSRLLHYRETVYGYILAAMLGMLSPSALAIAFPIENPSVVRAGGAIPFVFMIVALPLARFGRSLVAAFGKRGVAFAAVILPAVVLVSAQLNYMRYFIDFDAQYRRYSWNSSEMAATMLDFARSGGALDHAWIVAYPYWVDTRNVAINLGDIDWNNVLWYVKDMPHSVNDPTPRLYILSPQDTQNLDDLHVIFPNGIVRSYTSCTPDKEYVAFYVPNQSLSVKGITQ